MPDSGGDGGAFLVVLLFGIAVVLGLVRGGRGQDGGDGAAHGGGSDGGDGGGGGGD